MQTFAFITILSIIKYMNKNTMKIEQTFINTYKKKVAPNGAK